MRVTYVLDACALLALLTNENGADKVALIYKLTQAKVTGGILLTSDHHEFDVIEAKEPIQFL